MSKKNRFVSLFTLSSMVFYIGCSKTNEHSFGNIGNELYSINSEINLGTVSESIISTTSYNNLNEFIDLLKVYEEFESKDDYISFLEKNYKAKFIKNGDSNVTYVVKEIAESIKPTKYQELQKNYGIEITEIYLTSNLERQPNYKFMLESTPPDFGKEEVPEKKQLEGKYFFEDFDSLEKFLTNDSLYHLKNKDLLSTLTSVLRGKSTKIVEGITTQDSSSAIVIDGFDDIATALESSGLSKKIVFSTQALGLYPAFLFFVATGVEGAAAQRQEGKEEYKTKLQEAYIQEIELENTIKDLLSRGQPIPDDIHQQSKKNITFKRNLLIKISEFLKKNKNNELKVLPDEIINFIKEESPNLRESSPSSISHQETVQKLVDGIKNSSEIELMNLVDKLSKYKADKKDLLSNYYETKFSKALTEGGLKAMYYGMASFEGRAGFKLYNLLSSNPSENIDSFANLLGGLGDAYLAAGQAQMVLAGIQKLYLGTGEVKKYNDWVQLLNKSDLFNVKNSSSDSELQNAKGMLTNLIKTLRKASIVEVLGNTSLTAGQFAMLVGGPFGVASAPLTLVGAGATIGGVAVTQIVEKFTELKYGFADAQEGSVEYEIINGKYDNVSDKNLDKIVKRVNDLAILSKERSIIRVWEKIYSQIQKNPNMQNTDIIDKLNKQFLNMSKENSYHIYYLESLNTIFPGNNPDIIDNSYKIMDNARQYWSSAKNNENSQLLYLDFKLRHLVHLKNQVSLKVQNHLSHLESYASENKTLNDFSVDNSNVLKDISKYSPSEIFPVVSKILDSFESFGLEEQLSNKIMSKLLKEDGAIWQGIDTSSQKMNSKKGEINKYLTYEKIGFENHSVQSSALAGIKSTFSIFKERFLPYQMKKSETQNNGIIKEKIIYKLQLNQLKNDLTNYDQQDSIAKNDLVDISRKLFFNNNKGNGFSNSFGKNPQNVAEKINNNVLGKKVRSDALSPLLENAIPLVELYDEISNMETLNGEVLENKDTKIRKAKRYIDKKLGKIKNRLTFSRQSAIKKLSDVGNVFRSKLSKEINEVKVRNGIPEDYELKVLNMDSESNKIIFVGRQNNTIDSRTVEVSDDLYKSFKLFNKKLENHLLSGHIISNKNAKNTGEGYSGLSKAFAMQALIMHFSHHNSSQEEDNSALGEIIKYYDGVNTAQLGIGVGDETKYFAKTLHELYVPKLKYNPAKNIGGKIVKGLGIADIVLSGAAVGFDIAALTKSETRSQKIVHGTHLAVDGIGFGTAIGGVATGSLAVGYLAVPLAGIGVGVTGIATNIAGHIADFENVAKHLNEYGFAYNSNNYGRSYFQKIENSGAGYNIPYFDFAHLENGKINLDVITELDLTNSDNNTGDHFIKLKRSSSYISKANEMNRNLNNLYEDYQSHVSDDSNRPYPLVPRYELYATNFDFNKNKFISIREALKKSDSFQITTLSHIDEMDREQFKNSQTLPAIVLPMAPETFYSYEFSLVTTSFTQNWSWTGDDFKVARKLHYRPDFSFSYHYWSVGPQEQGITDLFSRVKSTDITVKLGAQNTNLVTPVAVDEWKDKITYHLEGLAGGTHHVLLRKGFNYHINGSGNENFVFDISEVINDNSCSSINNFCLRKENNIVFINGVKLTFDDKLESLKNIKIIRKKGIQNEYQEFNLM